MCPGAVYVYITDSKRLQEQRLALFQLQPEYRLYLIHPEGLKCQQLFYPEKLNRFLIPQLVEKSQK